MSDKPRIAYAEGYRYQLREDYSIQLEFPYYRDVKTDFLELTTKGVLTIRKGYAWDGPSGPVFDGDAIMRPSLVHDALYQLMRLEVLHKSRREYADELLRRLCLEDGMSSISAWFVYHAVRLFGETCTEPWMEKETQFAPE